MTGEEELDESLVLNSIYGTLFTKCYICMDHCIQNNGLLIRKIKTELYIRFIKKGMLYMEHSIWKDIRNVIYRMLYTECYIQNVIYRTLYMERYIQNVIYRTL